MLPSLMLIELKVVQCVWRRFWLCEVSSCLRRLELRVLVVVQERASVSVV